MLQEYTLAEFVTRFKAGEFDAPDVHTQCAAGWFDWFCRDKSLANKTKRLGRLVCRIADSKKFDASKVYVFFKNNCPMVGTLYDSFSICDKESGDVLFWVTPSVGYKSEHNQAQVYDILNPVYDPKDPDPVLETKNKLPNVEGKVKDIVEFFNS